MKYWVLTYGDANYRFAQDKHCYDYEEALTEYNRLTSEGNLCVLNEHVITPLLSNIPDDEDEDA